MMDMKKISDESGKLIEYLTTRELKSDEKIATLRAAAGTIESVLNAEMITLMMQRILTGQILPGQGRNN